jgi:hypothetical protein
MSFLSFLKKAGQILANVGAVEAGLAPIFQAALPAGSAASNVVDKLDLIFKSVVATEGQFAAAFPTTQTGPQKLLAAASLVGPVLATIDTIRGKPIANEAAYAKAIQTITGGVADLMNALQPKAASASTAGAVVAAPAAAISTVALS